MFAYKQEWQKKRKYKELEDQKAEDDAKRLKEDDVVTWTGKKLANYDKLKRPGHLIAAEKQKEQGK